jgi:DNA primase catalytic core, N-terminal domain
MHRDGHNAPLSAVCEHPPISATRDMVESRVEEERLEQLLADAAAFFEAFLWESDAGSPARDRLASEGLDEEIVRAFGVGYAPIGPDQLMNHLRGLGYSTEELVEAGLATRSVRGRAHAHLRSRLTFPVKDSGGRILGFAGLGTHVGPSWALWVTSPDTGLYQRAEGIFGLDKAARQIAATGTASVERDSIEVLKAHQRGETNAVTVHSSGVTHPQLLTLAADVPGGIDALRLEVPDGMPVDWQPEDSLPAFSENGRPAVSGSAESEVGGRYVHLKKVAIVIATGLAAVNVWTGAPLLAVWVGSHAQDGKVVSLRGVATVLVVLGVLAFLLAWALAWLHAKYDELSGRPPTLTRTSPWYRRMRGELDEHLRVRYSLSAPERVVAACVIAGVLAFEVWFFLIAGSPLGN